MTSFGIDHFLPRMSYSSRPTVHVHPGLVLHQLHRHLHCGQQLAPHGARERQMQLKETETVDFKPKSFMQLES